MEGFPSYELHCITRARERYGLELTISDLDTIRNSIMAGGTLLLKKYPHRSEVHVVRFVKTLMLLVWVPEDQRIATFLPRETAHPEVNLQHKARLKASRSTRFRDRDEQWNERTRSYA